MGIPIGDVLQSDYQDPNIPGKLGPVVLGDYVGRFARLTMTAVQFIGLWHDKIEFIPAPGPGNFIIPGDMVVQRQGRVQIDGTPDTVILQLAWVEATGGVETVPLAAAWGTRLVDDQPSNPAVVPVDLFRSDFVALGKPQTLNFRANTLFEDTPLTWALTTQGSGLTEAEWDTTFAPLLDQRVPVYLNSVFVPGRDFEFGLATVGGGGQLVSVEYTYPSPVTWNPATFSLVVGGATGTGAVVDPVLDANGIVTGLSITSSGSGYAAIPTTVTFEMQYRIWSP